MTCLEGVFVLVKVGVGGEFKNNNRPTLVDSIWKYISQRWRFAQADGAGAVTSIKSLTRGER
jgi:hypothetical protein